MERPAVQKGLDVPERNWIKEALADPEKVRHVIVDFVVPDVTGQRDIGRHEEGGLWGGRCQSLVSGRLCHFIFCNAPPAQGDRLGR